VEWHFTDWYRVSVKGKRKFECSKCDPDVQSRRGCHIDRWDLTTADAPAIPVKLNDDLPGHPFCPSKLFRDDPAFVIYCEQLFVLWQTGKDTFDDTLGIETAADLVLLIKHWKRMEHHRDVLAWGRIWGGDQEEGTK
jgi:hypothetical protein